MQSSSLILWSRCRQTLLPARTRATALGTTISQRWRSGQGSAPSYHSPKGPWRPDKRKPPFNSGRTPWRPPKPTSNEDAFSEDSETSSNARDIFLKHLEEWKNARATMNRLQAFGIPQHDARTLQTAFVEAVNQGVISGPDFDGTLELFKDRVMARSRAEYYQRLVTSIFYSWACNPARSEAIVKSTAVPTKTLDQMRRLRDTVADLQFPAEGFPAARSLHRKIIMHVGPTNSGKTHNALRALAASEKGIYAGPLRLLAHEIWERLNLGEIVPLGIDMNAPPPAITTGEDGSEIIPYARECNLITGEEQKIVSEHASLISCTVEMVPFGPAFDVAVIDEIQMIADPERGGGWTNAVLGLNAKEIHLCGEEAAVPVIRELLKDTGDDLEVKRYERLTPLTVAENSLDGNFKNIRKGDCLITFSRTGIYALKRRVEQASGLRCAVAYGLLPPELRSEQAALFNDPNSGYDVMIGSDAIGMGLNLKIKRVIFESMSKWDGYSNRILDAAQAKQIAGRAGRFGLHEPGESVGVATTLYPDDLEHLRKAVGSQPKPLIGAYLSPGTQTFPEIASTLPSDANQVTVFDVFRYITPVRSVYRVVEHKGIEKMMSLINKIGAVDSLRMEDKGLIILAPIPWNNPDLVAAVSKCLHMYHRDMMVPIEAWLGDSSSMKYLEEIEKKMKANKPPNSNPTALSLLESLHKCLVFYLWMSYRSPVVFYQQVQAHALKERVEKALDYSLRDISFTSRLRRSKTPVVHGPIGGQEKLSRVSWMTRESLQKARLERTTTGSLRPQPTPREMYRAPVEIAKE